MCLYKFVSKEPFNYLENTTAFAGKSSVNHHETSQKQSTGKDLIFWGRKKIIRNELLIPSQIAWGNTNQKEMLFSSRK